MMECFGSLERIRLRIYFTVLQPMAKFNSKEEEKKGEFIGLTTVL